jgi:nucleoside-diphosphate-sugar epimerase
VVERVERTPPLDCDGEGILVSRLPVLRSRLAAFLLRRRQFPLVGSGAGVSSFVHLEDAAAATVLALDHEGPAIYNVVDDEPAPVREWLPVLADALGAKPPGRLPVWLARLFAGEAGVVLGTESRGASNAKAKRELGWTLRYPSWRQGFAEVYAKATVSRASSRRSSDLYGVGRRPELPS